MKRIAAMIGLVLLVWPAVATAADLDALRAEGVVGESFDGLAVARERADAAAKKVVAGVNAKRAQIYAERAKTEGVPAAEVGKVYALEIAGKAPGGTWFLGEDGKWTRKQ